MVRKSIIAFATAAALGAAVIPTGASAAWHGGFHGGHGFHGGFHPGFHPGFRHFGFRHHDRFFVRDRFFFGPSFAFVDGPGCVRVRRVWTPWGWRWRRIWVCG
jgi:hypothetical protein